MFGKLMKYELKSLSKGLLPLYGAILIVAAINAVMMGTSAEINVDGWAQVTAIMLYTALCVSVAVMTLIIIVQRFYKGLLGQEGYLMFTLPVPTWQLTCSKLLGASLMCILSGIVGITSVLILGAGTFVGPDFFAELREILTYIDGDSILFLFEILIGMLVDISASICQIYLAIALGHLSNQHRVAMSIVWYIAINTVLTFIGAVLTNVTMNAPGVTDFIFGAIFNSGISNVHEFMWIGIAISAVQGAIFYFITNYVLKNKLNLE
ncbi:MAG: hypothetical protein KHY89_07335 [Butyricicoccus pullicaecorum]|nr:hypothetical protein [Butyricicoccus pullicaecorum]